MVWSGWIHSCRVFDKISYSILIGVASWIEAWMEAFKSDVSSFEGA